MSRLPRLTLPGYPHHILQRGNNRQAIAVSVADYQRLLALLEEYGRKFQVAIHAYVLMGDHFQLLATPQTADGLPQLMQAVGRRYVRYFNEVQQRSGTLWEGRYRSTLIQADRYLFACMASIDLQPVRAGLVSRAQDYPWSSHGHYVGQRTDKLITPHSQIWGLGNTPFARDAAYAELVQTGLNSGQEASISTAVLRGWVLGEAGFVAALQNKTPRRLTKSTAGRPVSIKK